MRFLAAALLLVLAGCATTSVPEAIREPPPEDLALPEVRARVEAFEGRPVRWGGTLAGVQNRRADTWLDIVARPLGDSGRPEERGESLGRFIARVDGFLDPAVYREGREVTVAGTISGTTVRPIGEYPYRYVIVDAHTIKLWEPRPAPAYYSPYYYRSPYYDPFYDPFYDPLWPARVWPWYAPYPFYPYWR
jgi:outer membrane lipoprotein